jgi:hypothetical protein
MPTLPKNTLRETSLTKGKGIENKVTPRLANDRPDDDRKTRTDEKPKAGQNLATTADSAQNSVRGAPPYSKPKENAGTGFTEEAIAMNCAIFPDFMKRYDTIGRVHDNEQWQHKKSGAKGK